MQRKAVQCKAMLRGELCEDIQLGNVLLLHLNKTSFIFIRVEHLKSPFLFLNTHRNDNNISFDTQEFLLDFSLFTWNLGRIFEKVQQKVFKYGKGVFAFPVFLL